MEFAEEALDLLRTAVAVRTREMFEKAGKPLRDLMQPNKADDACRTDSRSAVVTGNAVGNAARKVRERAVQIASELFEANPADIALD